MPLLLSAALAQAADAQGDDDVLGLRPQDQVLGVGLGAGAFAGARLDEALPGNASWLPIVLGVGGGLAPGVLGREPVPASAGLRAATFTAAGAWTGDRALRLALSPDTELRPELVAVGGAAGDLLGFGLALGVQPRGSWSREEWALVAGSGIVGGGLGAGGSRALGLDEQGAAGLELGLTWVGLGASSLGVRQGGFELNPARQVMWTAQGAWIGGWLPALAPEGADPDLRAGTIALGSAAGWVLGGSLDTGPRTVGEFASSTAWGVTGATLGYGLPLAIGGEEAREVAIGTMLVGGVGGAVLGTHLAGSYDDDLGDVTVVFGGQAWAVASASSWAAWARDSGEASPLATGMTAWGVNSALAIGVPVVLDMKPGEALGAGSAAVWSMWFTHAVLPDHDSPRHRLATSIAGETGLVLGGLVAIGDWDPSAAQIGIIDGAGVLGGGLGYLGSSLATEDPQARLLGALGGSVLGLAGGVLLARDPASAQRLTLPQLRLPFGADLGLAPWQAPDGSQGLYLHLDLRNPSGGPPGVR